MPNKLQFFQVDEPKILDMQHNSPDQFQVPMNLEIESELIGKQASHLVKRKLNQLSRLSQFHPSMKDLTLMTQYMDK